MKLKKSVLGFIIYILYGILIISMLGLVLYAMAQKIMLSGSVKSAEAFLPVVVIAVTLLLLFLVNLFAKKLLPRVKITQRWKIIIEVFCVIAIFAAAIILRLQMAASAPMPIGDNIFFKMASVQNSRADFYMGNNASMVYGYTLSLVLSLFGNKEAVCIAFQAVLQCLALGMLYLTVRNISGVLTAVLAVAALALSPTYINTMFPLGPEMLFQCICIFTLFVFSVIWRHNERGDYRKMTKLIVFVISGILTGLVIFMDFFAFTLFVIAMFGIVLSNATVKEKMIDGPWLKVSAYFAGTVVGCISLFTWKAIAFGVTPEQVIMEYMKDLGSGFELVFQQLLPSLEGNTATVILIAAGVWILNYWKADRDEAIPYCLLLVGAVAAGIVLPDTLDYSIFMLMAWMVLAAVGVRSLFERCLEETDVERLVPEKEQKTQLPEPEQQEAPKAIQYIVNPLPVPKKHVKKEMDYAFIPEDTQMHYDLTEQKGNDDFEI